MSKFSATILALTGSGVGPVPRRWSWRSRSRHAVSGSALRAASRAGPTFGRQFLNKSSLFVLATWLGPCHHGMSIARNVQ